MKRNWARRDSIVPLAGWLLADIFLVLGVVWLGSQPFVKVDKSVLDGPKAQQSFKLALDTRPKVIEVSLNARGVRAKSSGALTNLHKSLNKAGLASIQKSGALAGLVLTFSGGDSCTNHVAAESTSRTVNRLLLKWYPSLVTSNTVTEAYVDFSCNRSNKVKLKLYTFSN